MALAEALVERGHPCVFLGKFDAAVRQRLEAADMHCETLEPESWSAEDAATVARRVILCDACGVVVDSYDIGEDYLWRVEQNPAPVLLIDDFATLARYHCSAVLNFTTRSSELLYPKSATRYFLGTHWFPARSALRDLRAQGPRFIGEVRHVLVTSGGPFDIVLPAVRALLACGPEASIHVVLPPTYAARPALESLLKQFSGDTAILARLPDLAGQLAWADLCISTAGLTKYEAAYVGVPLGIFAQNEGQTRDAARFAALGMALNFGSAEEIDLNRLTSDLRQLMTDGATRELLQRNARAMFPPDPTADLASALINEVFI